MRASLYARYSTDLQNVASIADQFATCRSFAAKDATKIVATFEEAAISGGSAANRPGLHSLMRGAKNGEFEVVRCEALDRLSRSRADVAALLEDLRFHGVKIRTISEGDISELQIGLMGTMNALQLRETGRKTRRGLQGVVRSGRIPAGASTATRSGEKSMPSANRSEAFAISILMRQKSSAKFFGATPPANRLAQSLAT